MKQYQSSPSVVEKPPIVEAPKKQLSGKSFSELLQEGDDCLESKVLYRATEAFSECIELQPNNYVPYMQRSKAYLLKGEQGLALMDIERALELLNSCTEKTELMKLDLVDMYHNRAVFYFENMKMEESENDCLSCIALCEQVVDSMHVKKILSESLNNLGFIYLKKDWIDQGLECFNRALEIRQTREELCHPKDLSKIYYNKARALSMKGSYSEAIEYLNLFLASDETVAKTHFSANSLLGECLFHVGEYKKAIEKCDVVTNILMSNFDKNEQLSKAEVKNYKKKLSSNSVLKGNCYLMTGQIDEAEKAFMVARDSNRGDIVPWIELGKIKMLYKEQYEDAIYDFTTALSRFQSFQPEAQPEITPETQVSTLFCRAKCYEKIKDTYSAVSDYEQILSQTLPNYFNVEEKETKNELSKEMAVSLLIPTMCRMALLYLENNSSDIKKALTSLNKAIKVGESFGSVYTVEPLHHRYHIFVTLYSHNKGDAKNQYLERVLNDTTKIIDILQPLQEDKTIESDDLKILENALYNRGIMYFKSNQFDKASKDLSAIPTTKEVAKLLTVCDMKNKNYLGAVKNFFTTL